MLVVAVAVILIGSALIYLSTERGQAVRDAVTGADRTPELSTDPETLGVLQARVIRSYADAYKVARVYGEVANASQQECRMAAVELVIRDGSGNELKTMEINVRDIPAGGSRSFDVEIGLFDTGFAAEPAVTGAAF